MPNYAQLAQEGPHLIPLPDTQLLRQAFLAYSKLHMHFVAVLTFSPAQTYVV